MNIPHGLKNENDLPETLLALDIGTEYINGVIRQDSGYLILLDIRRLFNPKELQKLTDF